MIESERAVLGACMADPQGYWRIADLLTAEDFSDPSLARLFAVIRDHAMAGKACDAVSLMDADPEYADPRSVNSPLAIAASDGWRTANVRRYADQIAAAAVGRRVALAGQRIAHLGGPDPYGEAHRILGACAPRSVSAAKRVREFGRDSFAQLTERFERNEELTGLPTSLPGLDALTAGLQAGDLIIVAARPSVGKTALAAQMTTHAAKLKHPSLLVSLEMSGVQVTDRVISHLGQIDGMALRQPKRLEESDWPRVSAAMKALHTMPLWIDESSALTVESLCARVRQLHATEKLELVAIDYLTQMTPPKANTTADALQMITRQLKGLAKDLRVPVLLLSQLNRDGAGRPELKHLRDSGAIEQDADMVLFLHRPNPEHKSALELIVAKQRNGDTGTLHLYADYRHMAFTETDAPPPQAEESTRFGRRRYGNGVPA